MVDIGQVTDKSINYVCKYHMKETACESPVDCVEKPFALMSRRPGIGYRYIRVNTEFHRQMGKDEHNFVTFENGVKAAMPRYYKSKIFEHEDRNIIAAEKTFKKAIERDEKSFKKYLSYRRSIGDFSSEHDVRSLYYQLPRIRNEKTIREIEKNKRK